MAMFWEAIWTAVKVLGGPMVTPGESSWSCRKLRPFKGISLTTFVSSSVLTDESVVCSAVASAVTFTCLRNGSRRQHQIYGPHRLHFKRDLINNLALKTLLLRAYLVSSDLQVRHRKLPQRRC